MIVFGGCRLRTHPVSPHRLRYGGSLSAPRHSNRMVLAGANPAPRPLFLVGRAIAAPPNHASSRYHASAAAACPSPRSNSRPCARPNTEEEPSAFCFVPKHRRIGVESVPMRELRTLFGVWRHGGWGMFRNWKPISTAPKDGTRILIFEPGEGTPGTVRVSCWRNDTIPTGWTGSERPPSHWLPLPLPPNQNSAGRQQTQTPQSSHAVDPWPRP